MLLTDLLVTLGALAKGRSSVRGLNQEIRRAYAHLACFGTRPYPRYIHTSRNCADEPSRGRRIGVLHKGAFRARRGAKFTR